MTNRTSKLASLEEAASAIEDGCRLTLGGFGIYQRPMAAARALVRRKARDLVIVGVVNSIESDLLIGAGCVSRIETSYVGLEKFGLALNFRRAAEAGTLKTIDYPELIAWDRFRASQEGLPFWPCTFLGGSDIARRNTEIVPFSCPVTGRPMWAVPPADPDVVVIHAPLADEYGNAAFVQRTMLPQGVDVTQTRSCDRIVVTAEKIVSGKELSRRPELVVVPAFRTTHVVEVPYGAHPTPTLDVHASDDDHLAEYAQASASPEMFCDYLARYVTGPADHFDYLDAVGIDRLMALRSVKAA